MPTRRETTEIPVTDPSPRRRASSGPAPARKRRSPRFVIDAESKRSAKRHYESLSASYEATVNAGWLAELRARERQDMLEALDLEAAGARSLIDIGCGSGLYALEAKRRGMEVAVVDASPGMIERIRGKVDRASVGDIEDYREERGYDRVVCAGVLDFVVDPELAFANLARLVSPGGRLVILVPLRGIWSLLYRFEKFLSGLRVNLFTPEWCRCAASRNGLSGGPCRRPLPFNAVFEFERPGSTIAPSRGRDPR